MNTDELSAELERARERTVTLVFALSPEDWRVPWRPEVNPIGWEVGHVGWFTERWVLREALGEPPIRADGDALWDSSAVAHASRWSLPLPDREGTRAYLDEVQRRVLAAVHERPEPAVAYHARYSLYHEAMHAEAFTYSRQTLGLQAPPAAAPAPVGGALPGDALVEGGTHWLGAPRDAEWAFDNEKWAHPVELAPFAIARAAVTEGEFAAFVEAGGYRERALWHVDAPVWDGPLDWRDGERRRFDRWEPLDRDRAMAHVSWFEADAYARWAGRRLPTEAEWERAAEGASPGATDGVTGRAVDVGAFPASDSRWGCRQLLGNVWEWTDSVFAPFPGFVPDAYADYSAPWFHTRKVLRGGAWATHRGLCTPTYRNFFPPDRRDIFAGFRTCAR